MATPRRSAIGRRCRTCGDVRRTCARIPPETWATCSASSLMTRARWTAIRASERPSRARHGAAPRSAPNRFTDARRQVQVLARPPPGEGCHGVAVFDGAQAGPHEGGGSVERIAPSTESALGSRCRRPRERAWQQARGRGASKAARRDLWQRYERVRSGSDSSALERTDQGGTHATDSGCARP